jgi:two-component system NtrC family sensor kinase
METLTENFAPTAAAHVLVLDDNAMITEMLGSMLDMFGYRAATANAGEDALAMLGADRFDVILSDLRMPGMDGQEFYRRAVAQHPELASRIVFLTGDSVGDGAREFLEETHCPVLTKLYTLQNVQDMIDGLMQDNRSNA